MPTQSEKAAALLQELLKRRGKLTPPTDRLGLERPAISGDFENEPMAGWEKAAALIGAAVSPVSTIASTVLAPPPEESLFDRAIIGPDGKLEILPETLEGAVPRMKKVQRKAIQTLQKFPSKPDYLRGAGSAGYSRSAKKFGVEAPASVNIAPKDFTGTARIPAADMLAEYVKGEPIGAITFGNRGKVNVAGVLPEYQGQGIGKELYKKAAMLGKNIYDLDITSQDAAKARYNAIQELAKGDFPKVPKRIDKLGKQLKGTSGHEKLEPKPVDDMNRMFYMNQVINLKDAFTKGEITAAGYKRARELLDSGPYRDVAISARKRAGPHITRLLDFMPK